MESTRTNDARVTLTGPVPARRQKPGDNRRDVQQDRPMDHTDRDESRVVTLSQFPTESMREMAEERSREISTAYAVIKEARGFV